MFQRPYCDGGPHTTITRNCSGGFNGEHHGEDQHSYPKLADEEASILQAHVALLLDDLLDSLENVPGHCNIPTHVDVSSLLP